MSHESRQMFLPGEALLACMNCTEGWRKSSHVFSPAAVTNLRAKLNVNPEVPSPPIRSNVQAWMKLSEGSDHLTDALIYAGRGEWFDVYKAIECLDAFAGRGESDLKRKRWVKCKDLELMNRTANSFYRHRRGKYESPKNPMTLENARKMLAKLIKCAFAELSARNV